MQFPLSSEGCPIHPERLESSKDWVNVTHRKSCRERLEKNMCTAVGCHPWGQEMLVNQERFIVIH